MFVTIPQNTKFLRFKIESVRIYDNRTVGVYGTVSRPDGTATGLLTRTRQVVYELITFVYFFLLLMTN